jgi:hypothetical protein
MRPLLQKVLQDIEQLTTEEQLEVISHTTAQLKYRAIPQNQFRQVGRQSHGHASHILDGEDVPEWSNALHNEWDD